MKESSEKHSQRPQKLDKHRAISNPENDAASEDDALVSTEGLPVIFPGPGAIGHIDPATIPAHLQDIYPLVSPGRPSKLTPELSIKILGLICEGHTFEVCCQAVGIDDSTLRKWRARAETGEQPYAAFVHAAKIARAQGEVGLLREARAAGKGEWTKYVTILERTRPERWSARQQITVDKHITVSVDAPPGVPEDLEGWQARRAARRALLDVATPAEEAQMIVEPDAEPSNEDNSQPV